MELVSDADCQKKRPLQFFENAMVCAGLTNGDPNICKRDSGGPLICEEDEGHLAFVGVNSFVNDKRCSLKRPSVFARVSSYLPWIRCHMEDKTDFKHCEMIDDYDYDLD